MPVLRIRNWKKWQSYRSDRGQPPWIKLHRALMRDPDWVDLSDAHRGQLVAIWLLAADRDGIVPEDPTVIQKLCYMDSKPDLEVLIEHGFIEKRRQRDANVTPTRRQRDAPEERRGEEEEEEETETEKKKAPTEQKKKRAIALPGDWKPTDRHHEIATTENVSDMERQAEIFKDSAITHDRRYVDWDRAFNSWLRRVNEFNGRTRGKDKSIAQLSAEMDVAHKRRLAR